MPAQGAIRRHRQRRRSPRCRSKARARARASPRHRLLLHSSMASAGDVADGATSRTTATRRSTCCSSTRSRCRSWTRT
eukprot:780568-Heterocapsa_arctica.AAC.1